MDRTGDPPESTSPPASPVTEKESETTEPPSTVYLVDNDAGLRQKLSALLESVHLPVETCGTPEEFLQHHQASRAGCLVLGVRLPQMSGLALYRTLRERGDRIPVIFLTPHNDVRTAVEAVHEGAFDFLQTPVDEQYLRDCVHAALQQDRQNRQRSAEQAKAAARFEGLSPKERAVLDLVMANRLRKDVARTLGITCKTARFHCANIMRKVNVATTASLAYLYFAAGLHKDRPPHGTMRTNEPSGGVSGKHKRNRLNSWTLLKTRRGT